MSRRKTTEEFIEEARKVHGDKYDYSKVEYINNKTKICIICPIHGEFWQIPDNHLHGHGCKKCLKISSTYDELINKFNIINNNKYEYEKLDDDFNVNKKIKIICKEHGEFYQTINNHLKGCGCPKCSNVGKLNNIFFIKKAKEVHGDNYDYSKVEYVNYKTKVCIICPIHGEFYQTPNKHLNKCGCPKCYGKKKYTTEEWVEKAKNVHGDKYDYSKVIYVNSTVKVCIICPIHGEFFQEANSHLNGSGCPCCKESHLECEIRQFLHDNNVNFEQQKRFDWLGRQSLDFYLPEYNIAIECKGEQHFYSKRKSTIFNEYKVFLNKKRDIIKYNKCIENDIKILYYSNLGIDYPYKVIEDKNELLKEIKNE